MAQDRIAEQVAGVVTCSNDRGFKLDSRDGWLNVSKFATVAVPAKGAHVVAGLDKAGFVREIRADAQTLDREPSGPKNGLSVAVAPPTEAPDRETRITRMACLNTATAILTNVMSGDFDTANVLQIASELEAWVLR